MNAPLIGPNAYWLIDMGISLSTIVDFASRKDDGSFQFINSGLIASFASNGPSREMTAALTQKKGAELLVKLRWLADAITLQQSLTDGDFLAGLIEQALYDPGRRAFTFDSADADEKALKQLGLAAMKANPLLARNVVMMGLRHALEDAIGGPDKAAALSYEQTYFQLGLDDFVGPNPCPGSDFAKAKLTSLFPNFVFEYRVTKQQKALPDKKDCPLEIVETFSENGSTPGFGTGVSVSVADFYVTVPSPSIVARGVYEQSDSLRLALIYRDRVLQALIDRNLSTSLSASLGGAATPTRKGELALLLLSKAWGWKTRENSM
jgi:hypothetical protein